ncbi:MAG: hypothetical protein J5I62_12600 [Flavobacteriales bacterium]|nr:hypothetical protein [Flavobacteriales bacterium]MEB2341375.1 hypothetical protein [Flavobacteriia bacterium]
MRKILTLLFLFPLLVSAQSWAPVGAVWTYKQIHCCSPDSTVAMIEVVGDTIIEGRFCMKLQKTRGWSTCYDTPRFHHESNDSLFYWNEFENTFELLFRWDAVPGDSWPTPVAGDTLLWTVADTGSVQVADEMLRNWTVSVASSLGIMYCPITEVTERLGPSSTPFTWVWPQCDGELYTGLRCYADSTISWINTQVPQCALEEPVPAAIRFDDPLGMWYVARTYPEGNIQNPNFAATRTTRYFFSGSMNFAGETWNRLHAQHTWDGSPNSTFRGAARQVGGFVLFLDTLNVIDTLYNFNVQVGDSVRYPDFGALSPYLTVESIDTVMIAGYPHRLYHFSEYPQTLEDVFTDTWIEGMGSIHGPLAPRMPATLGYHYGFPDSTRTTCYFHWQDLLWHHPGYASCVTNILLGVDELATRPITVYPNPVSDLLRVQGLSAKPWTYRLVDAVGRIWASGQWPITQGPRELGSVPSRRVPTCFVSKGPATTPSVC